MKQIRSMLGLASPMLALFAVLLLLRNLRVSAWSGTDRTGDGEGLPGNLAGGEPAAGSRGLATGGLRFRPWRRVVAAWTFLAQRDASGEQEWMDLPDRDPDELAEMFMDLRRVNRWLGGAWMTSRALDRVFGDRPASARITILDVATGSADIPRLMSRWARRRGRHVSVVATDINPEVLQLTRDLGAPDAVQPVAADALRLPFADDAFDVAACSFFLHHLDPDDVVAALREMRRVSRDGVLINDMVRSRTSYLGAWSFSRIFTRNPISRHDAPLSARRSYTRAELVAMAAQAGLEPVASYGFFGYRVVMVTTDGGTAKETPTAERRHRGWLRAEFRVPSAEC